MRPASQAERDLRDARARSARAGSSTCVQDQLIAATRVSAESWHALGAGDPRRVDAKDARRAFEHECGRLCLHGLARHEPETFRELCSELSSARKKQEAAARAEETAPTRADGVYDTAIAGVDATALHAAAQAARAAAKLPATETLEHIETKVYHDLLDLGCCQDGALALVRHWPKWAYGRVRKRAADDATGTGGAPTEDDTTGAAGPSGASRAPGIDDKRNLKHLLPASTVRAASALTVPRVALPRLLSSLAPPLVRSSLPAPPPHPRRIPQRFARPAVRSPLPAPPAPPARASCRWQRSRADSRSDATG